MQSFFNPAEHSDILIPMYGKIHLLTLAGVVVLVLLMMLNKKGIRRLAGNRRFMVRFIMGYMLIEMLYWTLIWAFKVEPYFERFPLHLCASLSILMPVLILTRKYGLFRFFSYWSLCAGFISFVNPSFIHDAPMSFPFIHYLIRHYFLFIIPIFMQIGLEFKHSYREFLVSIASLAGYALFIFFLDWATGANYMHLGKHNPLDIGFLPSSFTAWPWSYPSFVGVGIILLHLAYLGLKGIELKEVKR
ncbi:YwaF family protein [Saccharicrinis sp. FJH62]|uniref:YwaF family protein n=1 Tax=Saccharicrinis sp. FJH62 TaxID=3344657 RepID=UPI0035D3E1BD